MSSSTLTPRLELLVTMKIYVLPRPVNSSNFPVSLQVLPRLKSFATWHFYLKAFILMGASLGLEYYIHSTGSYVWYLMMPLGLLFALIGKLTEFPCHQLKQLGLCLIKEVWNVRTLLVHTCYIKLAKLSIQTKLFFIHWLHLRLSGN